MRTPWRLDAGPEATERRTDSALGAPGRTAPAEVAPGIVPVPHALRVLLVEDDPADARILVDHLASSRTLRFDVRTCATLAEGVARAVLGGADVVLLDLGLPDSAGLTTCRRFLAEAPALPVLVLTGLDGEALGVEAVKEGAQDFLPKDGLAPAALGRAIRHSVERHALVDAVRRAAADARDREQGLRRLLERSVEALVVLTGDGTVRFANRAASALLGRDAADLEGTSWVDVCPPAAEGSGDGPREVLLPRPAGAGTTAEVRSTAIEWEGRPATLVSLLDLTDRRRAERLALARSVQRSFLPERAVTDLGRLGAAALSELCEDVGGDFYDFVRLPDGRLLVALGDVTGHGVGAALLMARAHASLRAFAASEASPARLLARMNRVVASGDCTGVFLTLFLAAVDPATARVEWSSAGHSLAAAFDRRGRARPLPATSPPLWVAADVAFEPGEPFALGPGAGLVVCSDGAVEVPDPQGRHLGLDGLLDAVAGHWPAPAHEVIRRVREDLREWSAGRPIPDDLTLLALRRRSGARPARRPARRAAAGRGSRAALVRRRGRLP